MNIVTIRAGGDLNGGFITAAQAIGELLISHGYEVESVVIDRERRDPVRWTPMYLPGDKVTFVGDEDVLGTITKILCTGRNFSYGVEFDGEGGDGRVYYEADELLPA